MNWTLKTSQQLQIKKKSLSVYVLMKFIYKKMYMHVINIDNILF